MKNIPIIFINRNRLLSLKKIIFWLKNIGYENITILDNASTNIELLDWYELVEKEIQIVRFDQNYGPWIFWEAGLDKKLQHEFYIVSDSDLVPCDFCPDNIIEKLISILKNNDAISKVGPALNLVNLSENYTPKDTVLNWEKQFWHKPCGEGIFMAPIDTTFAMYRKEKSFTNNPFENIRLGYPYIFEHIPWLVDEKNLSDEEIFYRKNIEKNFSYWSQKLPDNRLLESDYLKNENNSNKKILHLGCGNEYIQGWINIDNFGRKIDIPFDLNDISDEIFLPIQDDTIDGFYMENKFLTIFNPYRFLNELFRVGKNKSKLFLRIYHGANDLSFSNLDFINIYFETAFKNFSKKNTGLLHPDYYYADWDLLSIKLVVDKKLLSLSYEEAIKIIRTQRNIVEEMIIELKLNKPAAKKSNESNKINLELTSNNLIYPSFD